MLCAFFVYVYTLLIFALHEISFFFVDGLSRSGTARTGVKGRERELAESWVRENVSERESVSEHVSGCVCVSASVCVWCECESVGKKKSSCWERKTRNCCFCLCRRIRKQIKICIMFFLFCCCCCGISCAPIGQYLRYSLLCLSLSSSLSIPRSLSLSLIWFICCN